MPKLDPVRKAVDTLITEVSRSVESCLKACEGEPTARAMIRWGAVPAMKQALKAVEEAAQRFSGGRPPVLGKPYWTRSEGQSPNPGWRFAYPDGTWSNLCRRRADAVELGKDRSQNRATPLRKPIMWREDE
jgi:hypothetical protein